MMALERNRGKRINDIRFNRGERRYLAITNIK
jgi:hypothetical protein